jgi:Ran-binding protein 3
MSPKPQAPKASDRPELLPQTSEEKFKSSTFGSFAKADSSPFGALAKEGSKSPFAAAGGSKLSSFAGSAVPAAAPSSGFGALGGSSKSAFGGSAFGSSLGGGFSALSGSKPALSSFGTASADLTIKGLKSKATAFGTPGEDKNDDASDEEDGEAEDGEKDNTEEEGRSSQPLLSQQRMCSNVARHSHANIFTAHETGEEGENTVWTGRAKLYAMAGETGSRAWKERGAGTFKFNVTVDEPKKARFVLRADGTHRLLLNAAVTKQLLFGGDAKGEKPKDGRLLFNALNADGELEMHLLRVTLWLFMIFRGDVLTPSS